ncbi:MAG: hypothetical protein JXB04_02145 [Kiritimatiellae bacterium]|nr:hypothetical protein [Kiritimatiellia bacterium]
MKALVTSVVRRSQKGEPSGFTFGVDLAAGKVLKTYPTPDPDFIEFNLNPRGGMRGNRGLAVTDEHIFIANSSHIRVYDKSWKRVKAITHPSCADIHDILIYDGMLWVASTRSNLLLQFTQDGELRSYFNYRAHANVMRRLQLRDCARKGFDEGGIRSGVVDFRDPRTHKVDEYDNVHLNSMCFLPGGDLLVSLGLCIPFRMAALFRLKELLLKLRIYPLIVKANQAVIRCFKVKPPRNSDLAITLARGQAAVVRVRPDGSSSIALTVPGATVPNHNLYPWRDGLVLCNDTNNGHLFAFSPDTGQIVKSVFVAEDFLRGMELLSDNLVAVGSQHTIYVVDMDREETVQRIPLADDPRVSIFDIKVLPEDVASFPETLQV